MTIFTATYTPKIGLPESWIEDHYTRMILGHTFAGDAPILFASFATPRGFNFTVTSPTILSIYPAPTDLAAMQANADLVTPPGDFASGTDFIYRGNHFPGWEVVDIDGTPLNGTAFVYFAADAAAGGYPSSAPSRPYIEFVYDGDLESSFPLVPSNSYMLNVNYP